MSEAGQIIKTMYGAYINALAEDPFDIKQVAIVIDQWRAFCDQHNTNMTRFCWWAADVPGFFHPLFTKSNSLLQKMRAAESLAWENKFQVLELLLEAGVDPHVKTQGKDNSTLMTDIILYGGA